MFNVGQDVSKYYNSVRKNVDDSAYVRLKWIYRICLWVFVGLISYTLFLAIEGIEVSRKSMKNVTWNANRADIVDRNGDILAKTVVVRHISLRPKEVQKKHLENNVATVIHNVFPNKYSFSEALNLVKSDRTHIRLKLDATDAEYENMLNAMKNANMNKDTMVTGLLFEPYETRKHPKGQLFAPVIGFTDVNERGKTVGRGIEMMYDKYLKENTDPLRLSLDSRIQTVFYDNLSIAMDKYQAKAAMGLLMNSRTGEMLAMVQLDPVNQSFNLLRGRYEMGSVFKVFNTAMAMENGVTKEYYVQEPYKIRNSAGRIVETIKDIRSFKPPRPYLTIEEIMLHSCNVGSAQIALDLPNGTQQDFFHRLHFDRKLEMDFGQTIEPKLPGKWGPVERAVASYGHGIAVTPMHLLLGINAMTNGGIYILPTLQKRTLGAVNGERVLDSEISERLRGVMFRIAEETTGRMARVAGIKIGGKTGTAEKYDDKGRVDPNRNLTVFAGVFPIEAPQYTMLIILDEPKGTRESGGWKTAAWNAVPTAGKILDGILPLLFE